MIVLCDIDGTIADCEHRRHFVESKPKNWDAFYEACDKDTPIENVIAIVAALHCVGHDIIYVSGRRESIREKTLYWLESNVLPSGKLYIRKDGDYRQDNLIKEEILKEQIIPQYGKENILCAIDDRKQVVDMWRANGIICLQVAEGNF